MLQLALNNTGLTHEMALLEHEATLSQVPSILWEWKGSNTNEDALVEHVQEALQQTGKTKKDLTHLFVVRGPGPFTALRVSLAFAKTLAHALGLILESSSTIECLAAKMKASADAHPKEEASGQELASQPHALALHAGGQNLAWFSSVQAPPEIYSFDEVMAVSGGSPFCFEGAERARAALATKGLHFQTPEDLPSLAEVLQKGYLKGEPSSSVEALYLREAHITASSDPWKSKAYSPL